MSPPAAGAALTLGPITELALLGAHCDDIALGAGGTLLQICRANPGVRVHALVLTGGDTVRRTEELAALAAFCPGAELTVEVADLPDGGVPGHWARARELVRRVAHDAAGADLVIGPQRHDAHQDHRTLAELIDTAFRDHLVWGYEIVKYESDLPPVISYVGLTADVATCKIALLQEHYRSQHGRDWWDAETFTATLRVRGVQSRQRYAEGFMINKQIVGLTGPGGEGSR